MAMQMQRPSLSRVNVGPVERGISFATGLALLAYTVSRRPRLSLPLGLDAGYMIYRGATGHCLFYQMLGINRTEVNGHEGIRVERAVRIHRPKEELYRTWRDFERLPRFMKHLESVEVDPNDPDRSHWVANAPFGKKVEWDAEVIEERENELLVWKSLPGSMVESMGRVEFLDAPTGRGTMVRVSMEYNPPAGSLGAAFARLLREDPALQIRDDLHRFKQMMESGEIPAVKGQPSGRHEPTQQPGKDVVEMASEDSFPASDPPGWISERGIR